mgnify:CR=1 FL=1
MSEPITRVAVVGAGVMGAEIALVAAVGGYPVTLLDIDRSALQRGVAHAQSAGQRQVDRDRLTAPALAEALERITTTTAVDELAACNLVIEAVPENLALKERVLAQIAAAVSPTTIVASNTSGLSISGLAQAAPPAGRVVGLHFFNPPSVMRLVEVIRGESTDQSTARRAADFARGLGKTPVAVRECPGFVVNRILLRAMASAYLERSVSAVAPELIDAAVVAAGPSPMGPHTLGDLIGLDTMEAIRSDLEVAYGDRFADGGVLAERVGAGRLGRKSGGGFFTGKTEPVDAADDLIERMRTVYYGAAADEANLLLTEGIATREDINTAMRLGAGWTAGPLEEEHA